MSHRHISDCPQCGNPIYEVEPDGVTTSKPLYPVIHRTCCCVFQYYHPSPNPSGTVKYEPPYLPRDARWTNSGAN